MFTIENRFLKIGVLEKGAELRSLVDKRNGFEWIWQADPAYWSKSSPVLFPIVGALKEDRYVYEGRAYNLPRHGFARDYNFELLEHTSNKLCLGLTANKNTRLIFPFDFYLSLTYELKDKSLEVSYAVLNRNDQTMYFALGAHPAFNLPKDNTMEGNAYIEFPDDTNIDRHYLINNLLSETSDNVGLDENRLIIDEETFKRDAWVLKGLHSKEVYLKSKASERELCFEFGNFPYFGIWSVPGASFICLEPWQGVPDSSNHDFHFENKEGIIHLEGQKSWFASWHVTV